MFTIISEESNAFLLTVLYVLNAMLCLNSRPFITLSNTHGDGSYRQHWPLFQAERFCQVQGGSNMTGTDLCVKKLHCAAAVRP